MWCLFVLLVVTIYVLFRSKRLTDIEFVVLVCVLTFLLVRVVYNVEYFDDFSDNFASLYQLPDYINNKISTSMEGLLTDSSDQSSPDPNDTTFLTPELFVSDTTLQNSNGNIDNNKYNMLVNEYVSIDAMLKAILSQFPTQYQSVFP